MLRLFLENIFPVTFLCFDDSTQFATEQLALSSSWMDTLFFSGGILSSHFCYSRYFVTSLDDCNWFNRRVQWNFVNHSMLWSCLQRSKCVNFASENKTKTVTSRLWVRPAPETSSGALNFIPRKPSDVKEKWTHELATMKPLSNGHHHLHPIRKCDVYHLKTARFSCFLWNHYFQNSTMKQQENVFVAMLQHFEQHHNHHSHMKSVLFAAFIPAMWAASFGKLAALCGKLKGMKPGPKVKPTDTELKSVVVSSPPTLLPPASKTMAHNKGAEPEERASQSLSIPRSSAALTNSPHTSATPAHV